MKYNLLVTAFCYCFDRFYRTPRPVGYSFINLQDLIAGN